MATMADLTRETLPDYRAKLMAIGADAKGRWGKLGPAELMQHLDLATQMSLGELPEARKAMFPKPLQTIMWIVFFRMFTTWPKGAIKAPAYFTPPAEADVETYRARLFHTMERFVEARETTPLRREMSPIAGRLTMTQWSSVHAVHFSHHFRQFGVLED